MEAYGLASARVQRDEHKEEDIAQMPRDQKIAAHMFASLRSQPRFQALLRKMNLA